LLDPPQSSLPGTLPLPPGLSWSCLAWSGEAWVAGRLAGGAIASRPSLVCKEANRRPLVNAKWIRGTGAETGSVPWKDQERDQEDRGRELTSEEPAARENEGETSLLPVERGLA